MRIYLVHQNKTRKEEMAGQFLWSPKKTKKGTKNAGYETMSRVQRGDVIFHSAEQTIYAVSTALNDAYGSCKPESLNAHLWKNDGWQVDLDMSMMEKPLELKRIKSWLIEHYSHRSAFTLSGSGKEQYLCDLDASHATHIIARLIELNQSSETKRRLNFLFDALASDEYSAAEVELVDDDLSDDEFFLSSETVWTGVQENQEFEAGSYAAVLPKRNARKAALALKRAGYLCEVDEDHSLFLRKNEKCYYTEPHHLIPLSKYQDFAPASVDMPENIVSLCSHCHNLLHYGRTCDKEPILKKLYHERFEVLCKVGLAITIDQLFDYYS